jgi:general secretion pathway protein D
MPRQVILEGLIVQVTLSDNLSFGLSYSMNTNLKVTGIKPFKNPIDLGSNASSSGNLGVNTTVFSKPPTDGFTFIGYDPTGNIRAVLTALEDRSKAKVVAAPHILVADNREARIQVGQQIPLATSSSSQPIATTTTTGTTTTSIPVVATSTIQYKDIGIILKVKPQVNDSGLISLELSQEISAVGDAVVVGGLDEISINKTEVTSNLVARDGETIIIGGLIREDTSRATSGVPFLSRIPLLGWLFGNTSDKVTRNELIILLTPHVVKSQQEASTVTSDYVDRYKSRTKDKEIGKFIKERSQEGREEPEKEQPVEPLPNSGN